MTDLPAWLVAARDLSQSNAPAWEGTPQNAPGYRSPRPLPRRMRSIEQRLYDPNAGVRTQAARQRQFRQNVYTDTMQNELGRNEVNTPEGAYFGQDIMETTGAPSLARGVRSLQRGEPGQAAGEFAMGGLGILGTATLPLGAGARLARAPRVQEPPAPAAARRVWHVSPHEFQPEDGFPVGRFRTDLGGSGESRGSGVGALAYGPGGYFTESPGVRDFYREQFSRTHGSAHVYEAEIPHDGYMDFDTPFGRQPSNIREGLREIYGEGPIARDADSRVLNMAEAERMRARGIVGTSFRGGIQDSDESLRNFAVFDGQDINLLRRVPPEELAPPRLPNPPPRLPGRATDGSVLPVRPAEPMRQSLVGGSDDLAEASRMRPDAGPPQTGRGAQSDLFPQDAPGPLRVFHGTPEDFAPDQIAPWSHFGTEQAARQRLEALVDPTLRDAPNGPNMRVLPYEITGRRIDVGEEYPSLIGGATHGDVTPGDVADLLLRGRHISPEDHAWATEPLRTGARFQGRDAAEVVKERLGEIAERNDIGAIGYRNTVEDAGSRSYIVPNPRLNVRAATEEVAPHGYINGRPAPPPQHPVWQRPDGGSAGAGSDPYNDYLETVARTPRSDGVFAGYERQADAQGLSARVSRMLDDGQFTETELPINSLTATQSNIRAAPQFAENSDLPIVIRQNGRDYVYDGHHRLALTANAGTTNARVRLVDLDANLNQARPNAGPRQPPPRPPPRRNR